jgi:phosphoglucomutase
LQELYVKYGFYKEGLVSITKKGMNGAAEIEAMMQGFRENPPATLDGLVVTKLLDYELQVGKNLVTGETWPIELPKSNVLQFELADGTKISARPSGTEPKIKFYFSASTKIGAVDETSVAEKMIDDRIAAIAVEMGLK